MRTTEEIVESIDTRLVELSDQIKTLESARTARFALDQHESVSRKTPRPARPKTPRPRARRALRAVPADHVESLLSGNGGLTTSELAARADANRDHVLGLLRELEAAGRVRRTGQRRGTRWHQITDEDRIRVRAAELEATRRRAS
jgi:hypothetical protein